MKNLFLCIIFCWACLGCGASKKSTQTQEKAAETKITVSDSTSTKEEAVKKTKTATAENTSTDTETIIKYKPEIEASTGLYKPFKMETKKDGRTVTSIGIDGSGEVTIKETAKSSQSATSETSEEIKSLKDKIETMDFEHSTSEKYKDEVIKTQSSTNFKLWIAVIILGILLAISIYFHISRTKFPFLNS